MVNTITQPQVTFLNKLQEERELTTAAHTALIALRDAYRGRFCSMKHASSVIDLLKLLPKKSSEPIQEGIYQGTGGRLVRVYLGQSSQRLLAKEIILNADGSVEYVYLGAAATNLLNCRRLTRDEVNERSLAHGSTTCMICGRRLDVPESVDRGIGPVCWENYA